MPHDHSEQAEHDDDLPVPDRVNAVHRCIEDSTSEENGNNSDSSDLQAQALCSILTEGMNEQVRQLFVTMASECLVNNSVRMWLPSVPLDPVREDDVAGIVHGSAPQALRQFVVQVWHRDIGPVPLHQLRLVVLPYPVGLRADDAYEGTGTRPVSMRL
jgi:hypothetical protein